jgi:predicted metal-binding transcription factor (methanogenesis marker protein 9)
MVFTRLNKGVAICFIHKIWQPRAVKPILCALRTMKIKNKNQNGMQRMVTWCCLLMNPHEVEEARNIRIRVLILLPGVVSL